MAGITNPNSYITRRELTQTLSGYVEKSFVLEYMHTELEDSLDNLNIYSKSEIDKTLENYITKSDVQNILNNNVEYYTKNDTKSLVNSAINVLKNVDLPAKLAGYVTKSELNDSVFNLFYSKDEIDTKLENNNSNTNDIEKYIESALVNYSTTNEIKTMLVSSINSSAKILENKVNNILTSYVSKESIADVIKKMNENTNILENKFVNFYSKEETNNRINYVIKNYCYTREETRQLIQVSIDFFKNNYLENKLDDYVTKESYAEHISNYYTKTQVDEKLNADSLCNIMHLTDDSYDYLKRRKRIKEHCLYVVYKFDRPMFIYIGSLLIAKRDTQGSVGFTYVFPITF